QSTYRRWVDPEPGGDGGLLLPVECHFPVRGAREDEIIKQSNSTWTKIQTMPRGGKREGAGRPKGSIDNADECKAVRARVKQRDQITREEFQAVAKSYAVYALAGLAEQAAAGSLPHIQELLNRAYGKIPDAAAVETTAAPPPRPPFSLADFRKPS